MVLAGTLPSAVTVAGHGLCPEVLSWEHKVPKALPRPVKHSHHRHRLPVQMKIKRQIPHAIACARQALLSCPRLDLAQGGRTCALLRSSGWPQGKTAHDARTRRGSPRVAQC